MPVLGAVSRTAPYSDVEVLYIERVVFDEFAARLDLVAHERREHQVSLHVILGLDCARVRVAGFMVVSHSVSGFISPRPL